MIDKWRVYNGLDYVGILSYDELRKIFSYKMANKSKPALEAVDILNADKDQAWFQETLFDRVVPPNRVNIRQILARAGLSEYDPWELLKKSHLSCLTDRVWMTKGNDPTEFYRVSEIGACIKAIEDGRIEYVEEFE